MGVPAKLLNLNVFQNGESFLGETTYFTPPKFTRTVIEFQGGGMGGKAEQPTGLEVMTCEWGVGGFLPQILRSFGVVGVAGSMLRFAGAYQEAETGAVTAVEIIVRGFHKELDRGSAKPGEDTEHKITSSITYYKEIVNGVVEAEIDILAGIERIGGVDRMAAIRRAIQA